MGNDRYVGSAPPTVFSTNIGPLADVRLLDTDPHGRINVSDLRSLPPNSWDGLIHVNLFGQQSDWDALRDYCKSQGKHFIVDNAVGLLDRAAGGQDNGDIEVISCHHTKPWGVGEGGLMIVNRDDESDIRNLMDFGARLPSSANPQSTNAKISDFAAAPSSIGLRGWITGPSFTRCRRVVFFRLLRITIFPSHLCRAVPQRLYRPGPLFP